MSLPVIFILRRVEEIDQCITSHRRLRSTTSGVLLQRQIHSLNILTRSSLFGQEMRRCCEENTDRLNLGVGDKLTEDINEVNDAFLTQRWSSSQSTMGVRAAGQVVPALAFVAEAPQGT